MKKSTFTGIIILTAMVLLIIPIRKADAIPAFARKYQISCQVCHSPAMPVLKAFGDEYAGAGFRMTEYESPRYFINTGDDRLSLFREFPLAVRIDGFATVNFNNEGTADFGAPFVVKILSGGELSDKLSYYFYFLMNERGHIAGLEDAFLMYADAFNTGINFYVGQFQSSDPLFKGELRLTLEPYKIYGVKPDNSSVDLKYDRGIMFDKGFPSGTTIVGEILNGSGLGEAGEGYLFDKDKYKNYMIRIKQDIGKSVSVGLFGYTGKEVIDDNAVGPYVSEMKMYGPDVAIDIDGKLLINMQYLWRTDSDIWDAGGEVHLADVKTHGGFAEIIYAPKGDMSKYYFTGLVNLVESQIDQFDYQSATLHFGYLLRRNVRAVAEGTYIFSGTPYAKASLGFVSAF
ncbi:MAG: hypothetical protein P1P83_06555 [Bacteroidales bacterium]|nr:hypothetical protein [Bacteroidales bacterium]MDT8373436.1 hypothetical protein [Bacteroidales bacterium]